MQTALGILKYSLVLYFGIRLSFNFAALEKGRKRSIATALLYVVLLCAQTVCWHRIGFEIAQKLYPLFVHLPIVVCLVVCFGLKWTTAFSSVFSAYLCCQIPRWFAMLASALFQSQIADYITYSLCIFPTLLLLERYAVFPAVQIMKLGKASHLLFATIPTLYYAFDFAATVYTDVLYNGFAVAVQFIPSVTALLYFVFVTVYYSAQESRNLAERNSLLLYRQAEEAKHQIAQLYAIQEQAAVYRHDLRHHFSLIYSFLSDNRVDEALCYLKQEQDGLDAITPTRYCVNNTVNLILSAFAAKAKEQSVAFSVTAGLPAQFPVPETELCAILSNALENAVHAAACVEDAARRTVSLHCSLTDEWLLICVENTCTAKVTLEKGLPVSDRSEPGHGYGTKSIAAIAEKHGGLCSCEAADSLFILRVGLPLEA